ncbi:MAG: hypothetical protein PHX25_00200 [Candidatus Pacebacteria bacterium]|nr:hypothetical protein [Candidatus Paceibacterota bacterium]
MEKEALDLLEMSGLFSLFNNVGLKTCEMDFPFRTGAIFFENLKNQDEKADTVRAIKSIVKEYMLNWINENPDFEKKNRNRVLSGIFDFASCFNIDNLLDKICSGEKTAEISVPMNGSFFYIKRFGNCLGFRVLSDSGNIHNTGVQTILNMCKEKDPCVYKFFHRIECSIPVPMEHRSENSVEVDFCEIFRKLSVSCPCIQWKPLQSFFSDLTEQYISVTWNDGVTKDGTIVGFKDGVEIHALIIHKEKNDPEKPDYRKTKQWRKGNIAFVGSTKCNFSDGGDLRLLLMAHSGIKNWGDFNISANVSQKQYHLRMVGGTLYTQLCCMLASEEAKSVSSYG